MRHSPFPNPFSSSSSAFQAMYLLWYCTSPSALGHPNRPSLYLLTQLPRLVPELRTYRLHSQPVGPHAMAMFEVNLFTPAQFGAFVAWLVIHRGPLSILVHPNTGDDERDHTQRAAWLGERVPLDLSIFRGMKELEGKLEKAAEGMDGEGDGKAKDGG